MDEGGWQQAFGEQARFRGRLLFSLAQRIVHDADEAEDICQTAFARAWEQRQRIRQPDRLGAWLAQVVVNESLFRVRRRQSEQRMLMERGHEAVSESKQTAYEAIERVDLRETLLAVLAEVDEPTRTIVVLRVVRGMPGNEVSKLLGCSASEVSRRLHRGLEQLRRELGEQDEPDTDRLDAAERGES